MYFIIILTRFRHFPHYRTHFLEPSAHTTIGEAGNNSLDVLSTTRYVGTSEIVGNTLTDNVVTVNVTHSYPVTFSESPNEELL